MKEKGSQFDRLAGALQQGKDSGFSESFPGGKEPAEGYMVSVPGYEQQIRSVNVTPAHIKEFVDRHAEALSQDDRYLGGWNGGQETSLDVSRNIQPNPNVEKEYGRDVALGDARTSAMDLAMGGNEESIYDLQKKESVDNPYFEKEGRRGNAE